MIPPLIAAENLHVYYAQSQVLRGVSLAIRAGETVGLMGRNGMGKTTLLRTLMGLVPARAGQVAIDGRPATSLATFARARQGIAYVPEGRGVLASLTVAENLAIAERRGIHGASDWTLARVLTMFPRLGERLANRGNQLSGGEQQMLAIARALLTNPRVLILDEATEGLAPLVRDEIWRTIEFVRHQGIAVLIVDKSIADLARIADRISVLVKGEVVFEGKPNALLSDAALLHRHLGV